MTRFATKEHIREYPLGPHSIETRMIDYMVAQLGRRDCVYFVSFNKWVKIGFSSCIFTRLETLDCLPEPIVILALVPGCRLIERQHHEKFIKYHAYAEWFVNEGKLAEYIEKLREEARRKVLAEPEQIRRRRA